MIDPLSRRDWLKAVGAAGAGALVPPPVNPGLAPGVSTGVSAEPGVRAPQILSLTSTSDVFVPPRGRAFQKFSFDFPEPSVELAGLRFGFLVFTRENAYALDASAMTAEGSADAGEFFLRVDDPAVFNELRIPGFGMGEDHLPDLLGVVEPVLVDLLLDVLEPLLKPSEFGEEGGVAVHSVRLPGFVADQEVIFGLPGQTLTIAHRTTSREAYVPGVLLAIRKVTKENRFYRGLDELIGLR